MSIRLLVKRNPAYPLAKLPVRGSAQAAGYDLFACEDAVIPKGGRAVVQTGIHVALPEGHYGRVAPRSGLAVKHGIDVGAGVVDSDYRGLLGVVLFNFGSDDFQCTYAPRSPQSMPATALHSSSLRRSQRPMSRKWTRSTTRHAAAVDSGLRVDSLAPSRYIPPYRSMDMRCTKFSLPFILYDRGLVEWRQDQGHTDTFGPLAFDKGTPNNLLALHKSPVRHHIEAEVK